MLFIITGTESKLRQSQTRRPTYGEHNFLDINKTANPRTGVGSQARKHDKPTSVDEFGKLHMPRGQGHLCEFYVLESLLENVGSHSEANESSSVVQQRT